MARLAVLLLFAAMGTLGAVAVATKVLDRDAEAAGTYYVTRVDRLPKGVGDAHVLHVNETLMAALPTVVRQAFVAAAREGEATVQMDANDWSALLRVLDDARREQGRPQAGYFRVENQVLEMSTRLQ